jgi:hypothetical protein
MRTHIVTNTEVFGLSDLSKAVKLAMDSNDKSGTHFTCFTGTKVQMLTLCAPRPHQAT